MRPTDAEIIEGIAGVLPVGVWVARAPGGEFVYANERFGEIMGMGARDDVAVGEYAGPYAIHDRDGSLYREERMPFVRALEARETVMVDDLVIHRPDGGRAFIRAYARPIFAGDEITHIIIAFIDISREVEAETRMRAAQRMEAVGNLAGGIAHDFNNLLAVVRAISSTLLLGETDPKRRGELEAIEKATDSAVQLTRSLLSFAGRQRAGQEPVPLSSLVADLADILERGLEGSTSMTRELMSSRHVAADRSQLEQVVMNLVLNARDAVAGRGQITLRTRDVGDRVVLEVDDTGPGVAPSLRDRIFEPYFTTKARGGEQTAGLGLATVYGIVERHEGQIEVLESPGGGARFRVSFAAIGPGAPRPRPPEAGEPAPGEGLVLVVDDDEGVRMSTASALEELGYEVMVAADGATAIERFRERGSDIRAVVLDMTMPELDGRETYVALRKIDANVRVVLTSGYERTSRAEEVLGLGATIFLAKPYGVRRLAAAMAELLDS